MDDKELFKVIESIVMFICIAGSASCGEAANAYYGQNIELQQWASREQVIIEKRIGKDALAVAGGVAGVFFVKKGIVNMHKHLNLVIDPSSAQLKFHWDI